MKRLFTLVLTGSLLITPALAADRAETSFPAVREPVSFSDVAQDRWYADAAGLCYETGLMNGTGDGTFSPDAMVTTAEAATLAARIHHILNGGDGVLSEAPADWGQITVTREDGVTLSLYSSASTGFWVNDREINSLYLTVDDSWKAYDGQTVTLEMNGSTYSGTFRYVLGAYGLTPAFQLGQVSQETYDQYYEDLWTALAWPAPGVWYRNTACYLDTVLDTDELGRLTDTATRLTFAKALKLVSGDLLEPINDITTFPDCEDDWKDTVLPLYQAGILSGVDASGAFLPNGQLSRAEMAAMAARLIRPALRLHFSLENG